MSSSGSNYDALISKESRDALYIEAVHCCDGEDKPSQRLDTLITSNYNLLNYQYTYPGYFHNTIGHAAIAQENDKIAHHLISKYSAKIDFTLKDDQGKTLLILAAKMRKRSLILTILDHCTAEQISKMINLVDEHGRTALHYAYMLGLDSAIISLMISKGKADQTILDNKGKKPFELLASSKAEIIEVLDSMSIDYRRSIYAPGNGFTILDTVNKLSGLTLPDFKPLKLTYPRLDCHGIRLKDPIPSDVYYPVVLCLQNLAYIKSSLEKPRSPNSEISPQQREARVRRYKLIVSQIEKDGTSVLDACLKGQKALSEAEEKLAPISSAKRPETTKIVYLALDHIGYINGESHKKSFGAHLALSFPEKMNHLKGKIISAYDSLKQLHPDAHIFIVMRESAIEVGEAKSNWAAANIMSETQKNDALNELKALTVDRDLILVPGTIAHTVEAKDSTQGPVVYNRAYVLMNNEIIGSQDKVIFHDSDLDPGFCKLKNPKEPRFGGVNELGEIIDFNRIIRLDINSKLKLSLIIEVCLDHAHPLNNKKEQVDLHLILSNSAYMSSERVKGKMAIHCDGNRPSTFIAKESNSSVYKMPLLSKSNDLYTLSAEESQDYLKRENDLADEAIAKAKVSNPYIMFTRSRGDFMSPLLYTIGEIYKPENIVKVVNADDVSSERSRSTSPHRELSIFPQVSGVAVVGVDGPKVVGALRFG